MVKRLSPTLSGVTVSAETAAGMRQAAKALGVTTSSLWEAAGAALLEAAKRGEERRPKKACRHDGNVEHVSGATWSCMDCGAHYKVDDVYPDVALGDEEP